MAMSKIGELGCLRLTLDDFDENYMLEALPEDYECPLCMIVQDDILECPSCKQISCKDCNIGFTTK